MPFLLEVFPEATVVVITRHPYHVAASHLDQWWAPSELESVLDWLEPVYRRWLAQRGRLSGDSRYVEVTAEELAAQWPTSRAEFFHRLGLADAETASAFTPARLRHRDGQFDAHRRTQVVARLGWAAEELGYPVAPVVDNRH